MRFSPLEYIEFAKLRSQARIALTRSCVPGGNRPQAPLLGSLRAVESSSASASSR